MKCNGYYGFAEETVDQAPSEIALFTATVAFWASLVFCVGLIVLMVAGWYAALRLFPLWI